MSRRASYIIRKLYANESGGVRVLRSDDIYERTTDFLHSVGIALKKWWILLPICGFIAISIYYFNTLTKSVLNVEASLSTVTVQMQRRLDLSINLASAVAVYASHEKDIFTLVAQLRTTLMGNSEALKNVSLKNSGASLGSSSNTSQLLGKLFGIAEQYPDLKLSTEFNHLLDAIVEVEKDIAVARTNYNNASNEYTTLLQRFPGRYYGLLFGFKSTPLFEPDKDAEKFIPMNFSLPKEKN